jgi:hypothetical protein
MDRLARLAAAALVASLFVTGCGQRKAEVETPTASATVSTGRSEAEIPTPALEHAAANAAVEASQPGENTILPEGASKTDPLIKVSP